METIPNTNHSTFEHTAPLFTVFSNEPLLSIEDKLSSLESLQQNLDLKEMMNNFAALVADFIRPFNIRFQSAHGFFSLVQMQRNSFSKSFNLGSMGQSTRLGTITYQSEVALTLDEDKLLTELHQLLLPSLKHALKFSELNTMVYQDHLTNIGNRAYYEKSIQYAIEQSNRTHLGLSLMILDINDFKPINDTYGHLKGDQILQEFARVLTQSVRASDMPFRLGGDEFAIILQPSENCSIAKVHRRINQAILKNTILKEIGCTFSLGHSHWEIGMSSIQLFESADQNLYHHKASTKVLR